MGGRLRGGILDGWLIELIEDGGRDDPEWMGCGDIYFGWYKLVNYRVGPEESPP